MSVASVAAAQIYVAMSIKNSVFDLAFCGSSEPYRAVMDLSRKLEFHTIVDGSEDYAICIDCLEVLVCAW